MSYVKLYTWSEFEYQLSSGFYCHILKAHPLPKYMILSKLINHDGGLHDFLWFVLNSKQTAHFIGNCRICDDQIAVLLQFLLFNLGISLEHCFSQRKWRRRRNKKLPSLFKVRREEYLHISSKICTCRYYRFSNIHMV